MKCDKDGYPEQATRRGVLAGRSHYDPVEWIDLCDGHAATYERHRLLEQQWDGRVGFYTVAIVASCPGEA